MSEATDNRPHVIKDSRGKRPAFYAAEGIDNLTSMVMVLASELTVLRDRLDAAERVARASGIDLAAGIESLELDEDALRSRESWRQDFFDRLFYLARKEANEAANAETRESYDQAIEDIAVK